jgi:hypothetical protein
MLKKIFVVFLVCNFFSNIVAFDVLAFNAEHKTNSSCKKLPFAQTAISDAQKKELVADINEIIEKLKSMDRAELPHFSGFLDSYLGNDSFGSILEEYQFLANYYLMEMAADNNLVIAPGCLSHYTFAFLSVFGLTPLLVGVGLYGWADDGTACMWGYSAWALTAFTFGLINWTNYRICAVEHSDNPDQGTINLLEDDKFFLWRVAVVATVAAIVLSTTCGEYYLN